MSSDDDRFVVPLYSAVEAARHLDVPASTFRAWARGYRNKPRGRPPVVGESIVTTLPADAGASIPFIGLAEAYVRGVRTSHYPACWRAPPADPARSGPSS